MKVINVRVFPNAKRQLVKKENNVFKIYVNAPAEGGRANKELIDIAAEFFGVKKSCVKIVKGFKSREKTLKVEC
jgi:uncharacterized protein (TIGR00251 family)